MKRTWPTPITPIDPIAEQALVRYGIFRLLSEPLDGEEADECTCRACLFAKSQRRPEPAA